MQYDHANKNSRGHLAMLIGIALQQAGFVLRPSDGWTKEDVYERASAVPDVFVLVYTSTVGGFVRKVGADAIRVCLVYKGKDGKERGLDHETRTHRVGEYDEIVARMMDRARHAYKASKVVARCECGAPKFKSSKGNLVCADLCWTKPGYKPTPRPAPVVATAAAAEKMAKTWEHESYF